MCRQCLCITIRSSKVPQWKLAPRPQFGQLSKLARNTKNTAVSLCTTELHWRLVARPQFEQLCKRALDTKNIAVSLCTIHFFCHTLRIQVKF
jgi:hypothetical protein